jgi:hypothetical protein
LSIADKNINYFDITNIDQLFEVYEILKNNKEFDTIVIDSISEIWKMIKDKLTDNWKKTMTMNERWKYSEKMMQAIRQIIQLDYNVVCIIHDQKIIDEDWKVQQYNIAVQWSAKDEIKRYFDIIAYTYIKNWKHEVTVAPNDKLITKDRTNLLSKENLVFDISKRIDTIKSKIKIWQEKIVKEYEVPLSYDYLVEKYWQDFVKLYDRTDIEDIDHIKASIMNASTLDEKQKEYYFEIIENIYKLKQ